MLASLKHEHMKKQDLLISSRNHNLEDSAKLGQKPTWAELLRNENKVDQKLEISISENNLINQSDRDEQTQVRIEIRTLKNHSNLNQRCQARRPKRNPTHAFNLNYSKRTYKIQITKIYNRP